jgi:hypothetical protein
MKVGDHVDVGINTGEKVGPGKIINVSDDAPAVMVTVERPRGGPYTFGAPRGWFKAIGPDRWQLDMPENTRERGQFFLPEEEEEEEKP